MKHEFEELKRLIIEVRDEAKADRKKCWYEDIEDKACYDGKVEAYNYCLQMIKEVNNL